ncbi:Uncharacterised protein [Pseudomonas putida]|jgi:1-acyl-sn-glycerol-3-phosphate acyltransferase|nr:hypothetical protein SAMN05216307_5519 [Pseudomonas putida]SMQ01237.1 hypothetical protein SAMN05216380_2093 [Pseudomonas putida]VEE39826.1 Uncharacterised protein [Pseudomonas putida]VTQ42542.1 Uncharacterised protein [Pseudomonas putida]
MGNHLSFLDWVFIVAALLGVAMATVLLNWFF